MRRRGEAWLWASAWWAAVDSNHLPPRYQHGALPVELAAHGLGKDRARSETGEPELYHGRNPRSEAVPCR